MALNVQLGCKNKQAYFVLRLICSNFAAKIKGMSTNNKIVYRAIALDLDGTLTNSKKEVTPATRKALLTAQENGAHIILASGRPTFGIEPVAECLELSTRGGYILSYNGGKIIDWRTKEEIYSQHLPSDVIPVLYNYAKEHGYALLGYVGKEIITESADDKYVAEESRINKMPIRKVENLLAELEPNPTKLLMTADLNAAAEAEKELQELVGNRMDVYRSAPFFVELVPKGIDKAQSLQRLLAKLNLTPQDMIAFGDGYNDLSMLRLAGMGVAMSNAAPEVRSEADYPVEVITGPEFVTGSTRMKAGTSQKLIFDLISTTVQIRLGRVEGNKMVNAKLINNKLIDRAVRIFMERNPQYTDYEEVKALILKAGSVKKAEEQKL
jgi:Cof subfamily protein (haloacid dehalogenase superfamily)